MGKLIQNYPAIAIALIALLLRLICIPFAHVVDADAVTRLFIAEDWLRDPHIITEGVWPPIHHYLNALCIGITKESYYSPMVMNGLIASLTAIPVYRFTEREFGKSGAWLAAVIFVLSPVVFRNSFHALSGVPHAFLVALTLDQLSLLIQNKRIKHAVLAGLFITLAAGFRYESWLFIAIFTGMLLLFKVRIKSILIFWSCAMIFPTFWMIGNYIAHHDFFFGLSGAYYWNVIMEQVNASVDKTEVLKRIFFFPISFLLLLSPLIVIPLIYRIIRMLLERKFKRAMFIWSIPFLVVMATFIYKSYEGTLLLQHRFSISLVLFAAPFTGLLISNARNQSRSAVIYSSAVVATILLSFTWWRIPVERAAFMSNTLTSSIEQARISTYPTLSPIPRLQDPEILKLQGDLNEAIQKNDGLVVDFWNWESSFHLALRSGVASDKIYMMDGAAAGAVYTTDLLALLKKCPNGIMFLNCHSKLTEVYQVKGDTIEFSLEGEQITFRYHVLYQKDGSYLIAYGELKNRKHLPGEKMSCPEPATRDFYRGELRQDLTKFQMIKLKAIENNVSVTEMLERDVQWLIDNQ